jgi:hypothetical protein
MVISSLLIDSTFYKIVQLLLFDYSYARFQIGIC